MPINKAKGNMYAGWVTHCHSHLAGACSHACSYCFVQAMAKRYPAMRLKYQGPPRLLVEEFGVKYGEGNTIFIEHLNDLFARDIPDLWIEQVLDHCFLYPMNTYVFQTKNPMRLHHSTRRFPSGSIIGTTIETNRTIQESISMAPQPFERYMAMRNLKAEVRKFITIEPVMDLDVPVLVQWITEIQPEFVNIGADSKKHGLPEPSKEKLLQLIAGLQEHGITVREKSNLKRLLGRQ